ncbi:hypothetical protein [Haladaptatus sp. DFWS20]|uniref:hypothetical protein n=1 Tax=Haladaptatus sp. DFWS20 TaxID=3403467 RepID=UPI003EB6DE9C
MSQSTTSIDTLVDQLTDLTERVKTLERELAAKDQRIDSLESALEAEHARTNNLEEHVIEVETQTDHLQTDLEQENERNQRTRASLSRIINDVREYTSEDGSSVDANSPNIVAEAATVGQELHDTIQRSTENGSLLDFTTKRPANSSIHEKYLHVLGRAEEKARETGTQIVFMNYREVATHYGCAYTTDGYRVMEEMADRVPGVDYVDGHLANPDVDATTKIDRKSIRVEWNHPDLRGWVRAHREG